MNLLAIDPGYSGGIATLHEGVVAASPMPEGMTAQADLLRGIKAVSPEIIAVIERTGTYVPGNSATAAAKFARHCGHLEAILYCLGIPTEQVAPQVWQKAMGALPHDKQERKRAIKEQMARKYPTVDVTLKTADALGILDWKLKQP